MEEVEKYREIYAGGERWKQYGHSNHGKDAAALVGAECRKLIDVGCGWNEFATARRAEGIEAVGVDFACPGADVQADAKALPFGDKAFDVVTAFDMLEHLRPEEVRPVLAEFARVARRFVFSISYVPSVNKVAGETLHPTVRTPEWWQARIEEAGGVFTHRGRYLAGKWSGQPQAPAVPPGVVACLVGNGPGAIAHRLGPIIDAHPCVVRFNRYRIKGYESRLGRRTDLWSTFGHGQVPGDEDGTPPRRAVFLHGEKGQPALAVRDLYRVPITLYHRLRKELKEITTREEEAKAAIIPSSGILVAAWLLEVHDAARLNLVGFDHFRKSRSSQHHYWLPQVFGRPTEHDGDAEAAWLEQHVQAGRVAYL